MFQSPSHRGGGATGDCQDRESKNVVFQSPSHRGGGATHASQHRGKSEDVRFQSPSHRGGGAATTTRSPTNCCRNVSIPFSSGRRRRHGVADDAAQAAQLIAFQSPSHRGGGAAASPLIRVRTSLWFQSPSHRGGGAATICRNKSSGRINICFNPLLIGEAAPPNSLLFVKLANKGFNPLLIGEAAPPCCHLVLP